MTVANASRWLRGRRDFCEDAFSFLIADFGYRRCRRRFLHGGFQIGYRGPGADVSAEWFPRDTMTVWLLPPSRRPLADGWGGDAWPGGFELETAAIVAGEPPGTTGSRMYNPTDEVIAELAARLRSLRAGLLSGDYSTAPAVRDWLRERAERSGSASPSDQPARGHRYRVATDPAAARRAPPRRHGGSGRGSPWPPP